tara:strand:+ start:13794 stop:14522 length:729 start_codon:yes stop_codon:yes gene_type:complete
MQEKQINKIFSKLSLFGLFDNLLKAECEMKFVKEYSSKDFNYDKTDKDAINLLRDKFKLNDNEKFDEWLGNNFLKNNDADLLEFANYQLKKEDVVNSLLLGTGESLYLRYKDRLDRVLYRLIRVDNEDLAHHLFYSIESDEIEFGEASEKFSLGPESKTRGYVGPVDLTTPHPEVASRLRVANVGQLFEPFQAENWYTLIRLEYRYESEFDEKTKTFLGGLLLSSKANTLKEELVEKNYKNR